MTIRCTKKVPLSHCGAILTTGTEREMDRETEREMDRETKRKRRRKRMAEKLSDPEREGEGEKRAKVLMEDAEEGRHEIFEMQRLNEK